MAVSLGASAVAEAAPPEKAHASKKARGKAREKPKAPTLDRAAVESGLQANDVGAVRAALEAAKAAGEGAAAEAAPLVEGLLARGASADVTKAAFDALAALKQASSSAAIRPYVKSRVPELRVAALRALAATKGPEAMAALREALHAADPKVRSYAAAGLGAMGGEAALPDLFRALDRGVAEAAAAIGQTCGPDACLKLAGKLGSMAFDVVKTGLDPILLRQPPLADEVLLPIVGRIRELGTPEAGRYLVDVASQWPASASRKVKAAIDQAIASIPGARGGS
jgi:HEAT repeat protein